MHQLEIVTWEARMTSATDLCHLGDCGQAWAMSPEKVFFRRPQTVLCEGRTVPILFMSMFLEFSTRSGQSACMMHVS